LGGSTTPTSDTSTATPTTDTGTDTPATATGSFNVSWTAPAIRSDGTALSLSEIDGYRIYYGQSSGKYTGSQNVTNGAATSATVNDAPVGTNHVVMTTYDMDGREGSYSPEIIKNAAQ
jgi:hypothetical protein